MPREVKTVEEFFKHAERAEECRVVRSRGYVKLKARTKRYLYTLKMEPDKAEELVAKLRETCSNVVEIGG